MTSSPIAQIISSRLFEKHRELGDELRQMGDLRGLLDPYSHEYEGSTLSQKLAMVQRLRAAGVSARDLTYGAVELMRAAGHPPAEAWNAVAEGLAALLEGCTP